MAVTRGPKAEGPRVKQAGIHDGGAVESRLPGKLNRPAADETRAQSEVFSKSSLLAPHTGHTQSAGRLSN
jgi:hypothetical protein